MKSINRSLYRHCFITVIAHENRALEITKYTAYIRLNDHDDRLKQTPLLTITRKSIEQLHCDGKKFIDDLPYSLSQSGPAIVDYYKKFILDKIELMNRYQYKGYWIEIFICQEKETDDYFFYEPYIELPNERGVVVGGKCKSFDEAQLRASQLIESWN